MKICVLILRMLQGLDLSLSMPPPHTHTHRPSDLSAPPCSEEWVEATDPFTSAVVWRDFKSSPPELPKILFRRRVRDFRPSVCDPLP